MLRALFVLLLTAAPQDLSKLLEKGDALLEEAKGAYEQARDKASVAAFVEAGFKLEEARIKFIVLQEIGSPEQQKIAADRIRAANQLSKLIHDGKVAVAGTPAGESKPPPPAAADPAAAEPAAPVKAVVDVTRRAPVPDAAKQRDAEKLIRDLFKDQYAKKAPADRVLLARTLLDQARKAGDDLAAAWVLCREAQDIAVQSGDLKTALQAADAAAQLFDADAALLRTAVLTAAAKNAKLPAEFAALAEAQLRVAEEQMRVDQYDAAEKSAAAALAHAKKTTDVALALRATARSKEAAEARTRYQSMKGVLEKLARNADDPGPNLEMGQFLCFVKGSWDLGLRFLSKGSDPALKGLADKDLAMPVPAAELAAVADGWWDQAQKEKSPLGKAQMLSRSRTLYEAALSGATGLLQIRLEKRMAELGPANPPVDLLPLVDPARDRVVGEYSLDGRTLVMKTGAWGRIQIPYAPPLEYELAMKVERKEGDNSLLIGLACGETQFIILLDSYEPAKENKSIPQFNGLDMVEGKAFFENETTFRGTFLPKAKVVTMVASVRRSGVALTINGKKVFDWKGDPRRLTLYPNWKTPASNALMLGAWDSKYHITQLTLTPLLGQGKSLRDP